MLVSRFLPWLAASLRRNKNIVYLIIRTSKLEILILMSLSPFGLARVYCICKFCMNIYCPSTCTCTLYMYIVQGMCAIHTCTSVRPPPIPPCTSVLPPPSPLPPPSLFCGQAFADLAHMKLDRRNLSEPIDPKEPSNLRGSFAKVVKRTLNTRVRMARQFLYVYIMQFLTICTLVHACIMHSTCKLYMYIVYVLYKHYTWNEGTV